MLQLPCLSLSVAMENVYARYCPLLVLCCAELRVAGCSLAGEFTLDLLILGDTTNIIYFRRHHQRCSGVIFMVRAWRVSFLYSACLG